MAASSYVKNGRVVAAVGLDRDQDTAALIELFTKLWQRGLHLITGIRRNMRNHLMLLGDKIMLRKRFVIETVFDILKCEMGLEHTRHRSPVNAVVHILSCLVAYAYRPGKPSISLRGKKLEAYP